jgi:hypothetical protein
MIDPLVFEAINLRVLPPHGLQLIVYSIQDPPILMYGVVIYHTPETLRYTVEGCHVPDTLM